MNQALSARYLLLAIRNQMSESFIQSPELVSPLLAIPPPHSTAGKESVGLCVWNCLYVPISRASSLVYRYPWVVVGQGIKSLWFFR